MQGLADGYFVLPNTINDFLADDIKTGPIDNELPEFIQAKKSVEDSIEKLMNINGTKTVDYFHKKLGKIIWNNCGMSRNSVDLKSAIKGIQKLKKQFYSDLLIPGDQFSFNEPLAKALRVADFMELGELFALDALKRNESCGGHFREEFQTKEGEAMRNDKEFTFVSAWEHNKVIENSTLHKEKLLFDNVELKNRSYK
jgi:succinate dehydrogenase / fumarate reductase flavoprotein subunit